MKRITIITINYNDASGLQKTMESVLNQDNSNFDYIVIDGESTDGSLEIIKSFSSDLFYWVSEKDLGIYNAMNKGLRKVQTEYVLYLNSGDTFYTEKIISHLETIILNFPRDLIYGNLNILDKIPFIKNYTSTFTFKYFLNNSLPFPASLIKKELIEKAGYFDENLRIVSDWKFFLLIFTKLDATYFHTEEVLVNFDTNGISSNSPDLIRSETKKVLKEDFSFVYEDVKLGVELDHFVKSLMNSKLYQLAKRFNLIKFFKL